MKNIQVTTKIAFCSAYVSAGELNSYLYRLEATVECPQRAEDDNMVLEFTKLQKYMRESSFENTFLYNNYDEHGRDIANAMLRAGVKCKGVDYALCAESICDNIAVILQGLLNIREPGVRLVELKLRETGDSYVSWTPESLIQ